MWPISIRPACVFASSKNEKEMENEFASIFQALRLDFDLQPASASTATSSIKEAASTNDVYNMLSTYAEKLMSDAREDVLRALVEPSEAFQYHNYESMVNKLKELNQRYPNITSLYTIGKSNEKRDLWVMIVSDQPLIHEPGEPEVKYIGNIHGDESVGRECLIRFIEYLCVNYGKNEYLTGLVNNVRSRARFSVDCSTEIYSPFRFASTSCRPWIPMGLNTNTSKWIMRKGPDAWMPIMST